MCRNHAPQLVDAMVSHEKAAAGLQEELVELGRKQISIRQEQVRDARKNLLNAQLATLREAHERGLVSDDVLELLTKELAEEQIRFSEQEHTTQEAETQSQEQPPPPPEEPE